VSIRDRHGASRTISNDHLAHARPPQCAERAGAIGVAAEMGISDEVLARGFEQFGGVKRRFSKVGEVQGAVIIDDYGHHPVEIKAVLSAARKARRGGSSRWSSRTATRGCAT
jgi:UDP-N-acetylmuramate--alanine ligase